jgi:hemolysin activation/secretion protein
MERTGLKWPVLILLLSGPWLPDNAVSQPLSSGAAVDQIRRPGQVELPPPAFEEPKPAPEVVLPPVPPERESGRTGPQLRVYVRRIILEGNTVFSSAELAAITAHYEGRVISSDELLELRDKITLHYIEHGYINSGAIIPDQDVIDGVIRLRIIEGELTSLEINGNQRLRPNYIRKRVLLGSGPPLNVNELQQQLQLLQENPLIDRINAALSPGARPGESKLDVSIAESRPYQVWLSLDNHRPPSVGATQGTISGEHLDLTGNGDALRGNYSLTDGLNDYYIDYRLPVTAHDTVIGTYFEKTTSDVVENPFDALDIKSDSWILGLLLRQPVYRRPGEEFALGVVLERKHSETSLLGEPFSFAEGVDDGKSDVTALRFTQDWLKRTRNRVLAARSVFSFGLHALGATNNDSKPDGEFSAWLGQFQWAQRLDEGDEIILRTDAQLTQDPLLPMEKFVVGGADTVRGYRENLLVRDNGLVASIELRVPVLPDMTGDVRLRLATFGDYGRSWNHESTPDHKNIASAGLGVLMDYQRLHAQLYWAKAFDHIDNYELDHDLQDDGVSFSVSYAIF